MYFYRYRLQAYQFELRQLLAQLKQFALFTSMLLYIAINGVFMLVLFSIGKIIEPDTPQMGMQLASMFLILQSLLLQVLKNAVLDKQHRVFQNSLLRLKRHKFIADIGLVLASNILIYITLFILFSMGWSSLQKAPHSIAFIITLIIFSVALLYRPLAIIAALLLSAPLCFLIQELLVFYIIINLCLFMLCFVKPKKTLPPLTIQGIPSIWLQFLIVNPWSWLWRCALSILTIWALSILASMRPDLISTFALFGLMLNSLWWSSLGLELTQQVIQQQSYWLSINKLNEVKQSIWLILLGLNSLAWVIGFLFLGFRFIDLIAGLFSVPVMTYIVIRHPKHLAISWGGLLIGFYLLKILL